MARRAREIMIIRIPRRNVAALGLQRNQRMAALECGKMERAVVYAEGSVSGSLQAAVRAVL